MPGAIRPLQSALQTATSASLQSTSTSEGSLPSVLCAAGCGTSDRCYGELRTHRSSPDWVLSSRHLNCPTCSPRTHILLGKAQDSSLSVHSLWARPSHSCRSHQMALGLLWDQGSGVEVPPMPRRADWSKRGPGDIEGSRRDQKECPRVQRKKESFTDPGYSSYFTPPQLLHPSQLLHHPHAQRQLWPCPEIDNAPLCCAPGTQVVPACPGCGCCFASIAWPRSMPAPADGAACGCCVCYSREPWTL